MKRYYEVQIVIDMCIVVLGLVTCLSPEVTRLNGNIVLYTLMGVYAGLEFLEYLLGGESQESLYLFLAAGVASFSGFFLRNYDQSDVISITFLVWILMIVIIKIINFQSIYDSRPKLFTIKLANMSAIVMISVLACVNIYFEISAVNYMLSLVFISYGILELLSDTLDYKRDDIIFLKE